MTEGRHRHEWPRRIRAHPDILHEAMLDDVHWPTTTALIDEACGLTSNALLVGEGPKDDLRVLFVGLYYRGDSTGLSIVGDGEWAAATHGGRGRRGWRKLHLGVDGSRVIVACALTEPTADDAITGISLVDEVDGHLTRVTADPAYDTLACYGAAGARGARVVVPPTKTASLSRRGARSGARDRTIRRVKALGRRRWKKASGYHQHARVENAFFRYTSIVGDCLRARSSSGQRREAVLACNVLNRMTELGRPVSYRIGR